MDFPASVVHKPLPPRKLHQSVLESNDRASRLRVARSMWKSHFCPEARERPRPSQVPADFFVIVALGSSDLKLTDIAPELTIELVLELLNSLDELTQRDYRVYFAENLNRYQRHLKVANAA